MLTRLPSRDERDAERCRRSLSRFIKEFWPILEPATPLVWGWHNDVVCEHLEAVTRGELRRLIINVPPRTMKSITACVAWPAWEWLDQPHTRWMFATYAANLSLRDSTKCRRILQSQGGATEGTIAQRLGYAGVLSLLSQDPWRLMGDQNAKEKYENTATGMRLATSVGAMATGEGGDRIVVDDPLNPEQARSETERTAANRWWNETMTSRFNNAKAAGVIVMQRLHEQDLTGHLLEKGGWHHLCLPAEYEPSHTFTYPDRVTLPALSHNEQMADGTIRSVTTEGGRELAGDPRTEEGELLEPVRLSEAYLDEQKKAGSYRYAGQYQQRPAPAEGGMFKKYWWKRYTSIPETRYGRVADSWDMRFGDSQKATSSFVVGQKWGVIGADRHLLAQIRARLSFTDSVKALQALADYVPPGCEHQPATSAKLVEEKANGAAVISTLKTSVTGLIPIQPEGGKDVRAAAAEPLAEAGNIWLPAGVYIPCPTAPNGPDGKPMWEPTTVEEWMDEHAVFPNGSHDDQVDAMTQLMNWVGGKPAVSAPSRTPKR